MGEKWAMPGMAGEKCRCQHVVLDTQGFIVDSTDTLFSTKAYCDRSLFEWSPFLESIFDVLLDLRVGGEELHFSKIDTLADFMTGFYDCSFMAAHWGDNCRVIVWTICDRGDEYAIFMERQVQENAL